MKYYNKKMAGLKFQKNCYYSESETEDAEEMIYSGSENKDTDISDSDQDFSPKAENVSTRTSKRLETFKNVTQRKVPESIPRQPTRVPNPKVTNRNALLARENRKRKKEMMDTLEQAVEKHQMANKKLKKALKSKDEKIQELEKQCAYFKSILANKTEIMQVIRSLNNSRTASALPATKSTKTVPIAANYTPPQSYTSSCSPHSTYSDDIDQDYGSVISDPFLSDYLNTDSLFTDLIDSKISHWDDTLIAPLSDVYLPVPAASQEIEVTNNNNNVTSPGICVHLNSGKMSIEFCASCHYNSQKCWIPEV